MKVFIKDEKCIGCGSCVSVTDGKIFDFNDEGKAYVKVDTVADEDSLMVKNAIDYCPTAAICEQTLENPEANIDENIKAEVSKEIASENTGSEK